MDAQPPVVPIDEVVASLTADALHAERAFPSCASRR